MSEHAGWRIGIEPFQDEGRWSARVEVWEPGSWASTGGPTHSGMPLPFTGAFETADEAEGAAVAQAKRWIDKQPK